MPEDPIDNKKISAVADDPDFDENQVKKDMYGALKSKYHEVNELNRE